MAAPRLRLAGLLFGATLVAATVTGCSVTAPISTALDYAPSDGVQVDVGEVRGLNLLIVTSGDGEPGVLIGGITNRGYSEQKVTLSVDGKDVAQVDLPAQGTHLFENKDLVHVAAVPAPPGALADVTLGVAGAGQTSVEVPVLDGTLPEYAHLVPGAK